MASSYPAGLDTFAINKQDDTNAQSGADGGVSTTVGDHAAHHNNLADAVNKIEAELGVNPSGASATVAAAIAALVAAGTAGVSVPIAAEKTANYTPLAADDGYLIPYNSGSLLTCPIGLSNGYPTGWAVAVEARGAGGVSITFAGGVTAIPAGPWSVGQNETVIITKTATNRYEQLLGPDNSIQLSDDNVFTGDNTFQGEIDTEDRVQVYRALASDPAFQALFDTDTFARFVKHADGREILGPGNATQDVSLKRLAAGIYALTSVGQSVAGPSGHAGAGLFLGNMTTEPTSNPTGGVLLYAFGGVLKVMQPSGAVKTVTVV